MVRLRALAVAALLLIPSLAFGQAQIGAGHVWGNSTAAQRPGRDEAVTAILDRALGSTRGAIIERGVGGWAIAGPGATAGLAWISGGAGADPSYAILGLSGGGCNAALVASNGGVLFSTATACSILAGTATARLPLLSGANAVGVWGAYTLPSSVTSGGVACFTSTTVEASSALLGANGVLYGGGAGVCPSATAPGTNGQLFLGVSAGPPQWGTMSQDCTITNAGVITCTKTNNVAFGALATTTPGTGVVTAAAANLSANGGLTTTIASGSTAMGTGAITSATCATVVTATATNTLTTDVITASFNGDPTAVTGYIPSTAGMLTIFAYPTAGVANFKVCNNTASSITPGAITLNWRVVR